VVVLAGVTAALHIGKLPPAIAALQQAMGVTLVQAGFLLSLVQLAGMSVGLAFGVLADGLGARRSMLLGLLLLATASALGGAAWNVPMLMLLRACEGFGFLLVVLPAPGLIRRLVAPGRLSLAIGVWGTYMPFGAATALLLGPWCIAVVGWRGWWWTLAALTLLMTAVLWRAVPAPAKSGARPDLSSWPRRLRDTLRAPGPWLVALCFAVYAGQWLAVIGFLPIIYARAGLSGASAGALTALAAGVNIIGNLTSGGALHRGVAPTRLLRIGFGVMALTAVAAFGSIDGMALPPALRFAAVLLFSAVGGVVPATLFALAVRVAPTEDSLSTTVGWMQQWSAFGQFSVPPLVAWIASRAGDWHWTWWVTGSLALTGWLLAGRIDRQLRR
jgi:predicted MFS family arabinose efflux permease